MKRTICILLAMIMVICLLPMSTTAASTVWDGTVATAYAGGTGSQADPYQIANGNQLAYLARQVNAGTTYSGKYFVLIDNIVLNNMTNWQSWSNTVAPANSWTPIGQSGGAESTPFAGAFNGNNHTVRGLYITSGSRYAGLFGFTNSSSSISDLGVIDSYIRSTSTSGYCGTIVGITGGSIVNCYNTGKVSGYRVGGILGCSSGGSVVNCWNTGEIMGEQTAGAIIGATSSASSNIEFCYNEGSVTASGQSGYAGGIIGHASTFASISDSYNAGTVSSTQGYAGGIAGDSYTCSIQNSYNVGSVTGDAYKTGLIAGKADSASTFSNAYYLDDTMSLAAVGQLSDSSSTPAIITNDVNPTGTAPLTDVLMRDQSSFLSFDFTDVWTMEGDENYPYPELLNMPNLPDTDTGTWDGTIATGFDSGTGTLLDPYIIMTPAQLAYFSIEVNSGRSFEGEYIKLGDYLQLNNTTDMQTWSDTIAPANSWIPIGTNEYRFAGNFNGDNHMISGMYVNSASDNVGLFGHTSETATIKNTRIADSYIRSETGNAGAIVGDFYGSIFNCYNESIVVGTYAGGICGMQSGSIDNCQNIGTITGTSNAGGIAGTAMPFVNVARCCNEGAVTVSGENGNAGGIDGSISTSIIIDCYNAGEISAQAESSRAGGIVGNLDASTVQNSYNAGTVTGTENRIGLIVGYAIDVSCINTYYLDNVVGIYAVGEYYDWALEYPVSVYNVDLDGTAPLTDSEMQDQASFVGWDFTNVWTMLGNNMTYSYPQFHMFWDGSPAEGFDSGTGTKFDPYLIMTPAQLAYFRDQVNGGRDFGEEYVEVGADLALNYTNNWHTWSDTSAPANSWTPIQSFSGTFDGNDHTIRGMYCISPDGGAGLFSSISPTSTIKNVGVIDSYVNGSMDAGAIAAISEGIVLECYNTGTVVSGCYAGGIISYANGGSVTNCWNTGTITGTESAGGIAGVTLPYANLARCYNGGAVATGGGNAGGICGTITSSSIIDCYNTGEVIAQSDTGHAGGIVGSSTESTIQNSHNSGTASARGYKAGLIAGLIDMHTTFTSVYYLDDATVLRAVGTEQLDSEPQGGMLEFNSNPAGTASLTDIEMQDAANFADWNFTSIWTMEGDPDYLYPEFWRCWDGSTADGFDSGTGTELDPYLIMTPEQLAYFRDQVNGGRTFNGEYVKVGANLLMNYTNDWQTWGNSVVPSNTWVSIGSGDNNFAGTFDGDNHTILGLYVKAESGYAGLFQITDSTSTIRNIGVSESHFRSNSFSSWVGGIAGCAKGSIINCYNTGSVVGNNAGGICCEAQNADVINCRNEGIITATVCAGGIVGLTAAGNSNIEYCYNEGEVTTSGVDGLAGGICGNANISILIKDCYNAGTIVAHADTGRVGGITGSCGNCTIRSSYNAGAVTGGTNKAGLVAGYASAYASFSNTYYLNDATALRAVGTQLISSGMPGTVYEFKADPEGTAPLTDAQMMVQANFTGFDFNNVWTMEGDIDYLYPELRLPVSLNLITVTNLGGGARYDKTAIRFGASIPFEKLLALAAGELLDYGFRINGLRDGNLTSENWIKLSAASTGEAFTGVALTAELDSETTTEQWVAGVRAAGSKVYSYDATTITFAIIIDNLPAAAQDSLWVFEPYVTINGVDVSFSQAMYTSINRILEDTASSTYIA